jgi:hypothetical protein
MPEITGFYYLLCLADAEDKFQEQDEINNLFYTTIDPIYFDSGIEFKSSDGKVNSPFTFKNDLTVTKENIKSSKYNSVITQEFRNAYSPEEIKAFFKKEKENGNLDRKVDEYVQRNASMAKKPLK